MRSTRTTKHEDNAASKFDCEAQEHALVIFMFILLCGKKLNTV